MRFKKIFLVLGVVLLITVLGGCGTDDIDITGYEDAKITLSGLAEQDQAITVEELKALDCITKKTHSTSDKIGEVRATGPLLETVLEKFNASKDEFTKIKIYGKDDYDITLSQKVISENDIILAFGIDGKPLDDDLKPIRIIIPKSDSAYWIRMVERIEFIK